MKIGGVSLRDSQITLTTPRDTILSFLLTIKGPFLTILHILQETLPEYPQLSFEMELFMHYFRLSSSEQETEMMPLGVHTLLESRCHVWYWFSRLIKSICVLWLQLTVFCVQGSSCLVIRHGWLHLVCHMMKTALSQHISMNQKWGVSRWSGIISSIFTLHHCSFLWR